MNMSRNQSPKWSVIWHIVQYAFFVVACIWLLYQIQGSSNATSGNYAERKLTERHIGKILGRKGYVGSSSYNALDDHGKDSIETNNVEEKAEEFWKNANSPRGDGDEMVISMKVIEEDEKSAASFGSVILKHDSGPSRRSDFQVETSNLQEDQSKETEYGEGSRRELL